MNMLIFIHLDTSTFTYFMGYVLASSTKKFSCKSMTYERFSFISITYHLLPKIRPIYIVFTAYVNQYVNRKMR